MKSGSSLEPSWEVVLRPQLPGLEGFSSSRLRSGLTELSASHVRPPGLFWQAGTLRWLPPVLCGPISAAVHLPAIPLYHRPCRTPWVPDAQHQLDQDHPLEPGHRPEVKGWQKGSGIRGASWARTSSGSGMSQPNVNLYGSHPFSLVLEDGEVGSRGLPAEQQCHG